MSDDLRFDALLAEGADALPPPAEVSPWQGAMKCVVWGIALKTLTLNLAYLNYILPALGCILLVVGFRTLRKENPGLRWAFRLSVVMAVSFGAARVIDALPLDAGFAFAYADTALMLGTLIALWRGMLGVSRTAGEEKPSAPAAGALAAFYVLLAVLAMIGLEGWLLVLPVLAVYLVILRNLGKLARSLENTGYVIHAAPVRLSAAAVIWGYLGVVLAAVVLAMLLGQRYPMDWQARSDTPQDAAVRAELLELGFPRNVLDDLTADEVADLAGAAEVYAESNVKEEGEACTVEHVAVVLPQDGCQRVVFIHHVTVEKPSGPALTEGMELWPVWYANDQWIRGGGYSGRVLCDRQGRTYTAEFAALDSGSYASTGFFGTSQRSAISAEWSRLRGAENMRAYVMYDAETLTPVWQYMDSWCNYARPDRAVYPFRSALAQWRSGGLAGGETLFQSALQEWAS